MIVQCHVRHDFVNDLNYMGCSHVLRAHVTRFQSALPQLRASAAVAYKCRPTTYKSPETGISDRMITVDHHSATGVWSQARTQSSDSTTERRYNNYYHSESDA